MNRYVYTLLCICAGILLPGIALAQPTADFSANTTSGCAPILVQFTDQSTGNPSSWHWDLGNGTISTLQNPSTTYILPGTYTVTLTVTNSSGSNTKTVTNYINVIATPTVNFTASDSGVVCASKTIQFTNLSVPGSAGTPTYFWDFGDGNTSTQTNPSHTYSANGTFTVTLNVINSTGCSKVLSKTNYITTVSAPTAAFTAANNNSCSLPLSVSFTNTSVGGNSYFWDFGDGTTSTSTNPVHTYSSAGSYNVTLIAANAGGCIDTLVMPSFVNIGSLTASFTKSTTATCANNTVSFTNTSLPGPGNSTWYFGDGSSFSGVNATHAYASPGTYTVKLVVNYNNCSDSTTQTVVVNPGPLANFSTTDTLGCAVPFTANFTNLSSGATSYLWSFGDGSTSTAANPTHTYSALGIYTVQLIAFGANGCSDTVTLSQAVKIVVPTMWVGPSGNYCAPATINFTTGNNSSLPITSYTWNFGDGTIVSGGASMSHTYTTTGSYTVSVTFSTGPGCTFNSIGSGINIGTKPTASFNATPNPVCPSQNVTFTNTSTGAPGTTYTWYFGDGGTSTQQNPVYQYSGHGTFTAMLVANNNGCTDTAITTIVVNLPSANYHIGLSCTNKYQVQFTDASIGANSWLWDFGDGTTTTVQSPTHTFANLGWHTIILLVTNTASGCTSTKLVQLYIYDLAPQFVADDTVICKGETVNFTSQFPESHLATQFIWDFGDGTPVQTTTTSNVSHVYNTAGLYTVTLVTKDDKNCYDTVIKANYISVGGPTANFSGAPTSGCAPLTVIFTDQSNSGGTGIVSRLWNFGDGTSSNANVANISHTYPAGVYSVSLSVTDGNGCVDSFVRTNYISANAPTANFTASHTTVCPGQSITFTSSSVGANLTYSWTFGDGGTAATASPTHTYTATGVYDVTLIVTDGTSCSDTLVRTAYINVGGINLSFSASDTFASCPPLAVNFTNTSTNVSSYSWTFGNGNASSLPNPATIYTLPGVYTVKLKGQNGACSDSVTKTITVLGPNGTLSYTPTNGCQPLTVSFTSTNTNTQQLIWDMNNGVTVTTTASNTTYTYTSPGKYVPKLLLSDGISCIVPIQGPDTIVVDQVVADFSFAPSNLCQSGTVHFTDTTYSAINPITVRNWSFGDGGTSTQHNPQHTYAAPGNYTVTLVIGTSQGCMDTIVKTVVINAAPQVSAGANMAICTGSSAALQATGGVSYTWAPATGLSCTNCSNPTATPTATTTYTVVGTGANGCADTSQVTVTVNPLPIIQTGPDPSICIGSNVQLAVAGAATYSWSPATGLSCTNCNNPVAAPATTTTYIVTGTSAAGCTDTAQITVNVNSSPSITATAAIDSFCAGGSTQLQASGGTTYIWSPATGLSCTNCANPTAMPATTTTYTVFGSNGNGCSDSANVTITVHQQPPVSAGSNVSVCAGENVQLQASGATSYVWSPAVGLSCTTCPNPVAGPGTTTTYTVTGTDVYGCSNTAQMTVTVNSLPVVSAGNDQTTCLGTQVSLQATGAAGYVWSPASGLSCTNCTSPSANPNSTTTYMVIGNDVNGCKDTASVTVNVLALPNVDAGPDVSICSLNSVQLQATGASSFSWTPATSLSCNSCSNPTATPTATTSYTVTGTDGNGCSNTDQVTVALYPQPQINAGADRTVCEGETIALQATGGQTYNWTPALYLSCTNCANPTAKPTENITYTVVGQDVNGCSDSDKVSISVIQMQPFVIGPGDTLCAGESASLSAAGGEQFIWSPAAGLSNPTAPNPTASPTTTTTYTVIIRQGTCFSDTGKVTVVVHPKPEVNAGQDQTIIAGASVNLFANASHADYYLWSPAADLSCADCMNPVATPKQTTTFKVNVSNTFGCEAEDDVTIRVACDNSQVFLANTFTPNGDGNNDRFYAQGRGLSVIQQFRVYSRWGELLYEARNIQPNDENWGWDGTYKGEQLKPDVYVYIIDATCYNGTPMQLKGDISLIR